MSTALFTLGWTGGVGAVTVVRAVGLKATVQSAIKVKVSTPVIKVVVSDQVLTEVKVAQPKATVKNNIKVKV